MENLFVYQTYYVIGTFVFVLLSFFFLINFVNRNEVELTEGN
ncbi:hypothetical protein ES705_34124 [subsurface metagenome]